MSTVAETKEPHLELSSELVSLPTDVIRLAASFLTNPREVDTVRAASNVGPSAAGWAVETLEYDEVHRSFESVAHELTPAVKHLHCRADLLTAAVNANVRLHQLEYLSLSNIVDDAALITVIQNAPELRTLNLIRACWNDRTPCPTSVIEALAQHCPKLSALYLPLHLDAGVGAALLALPALRRLWVGQRSFGKVPDAVLTQLGARLTHLRLFEVESPVRLEHWFAEATQLTHLLLGAHAADAVSAAGVERLIGVARNLHTLWISGVPSINAEALTSLLRAAPNLVSFGVIKNPALNDNVLRVLTEPGVATRLRTLSLCSDAFGGEALRNLLDARPELTSLRVDRIDPAAIVTAFKGVSEGGAAKPPLGELITLVLGVHVGTDGLLPFLIRRCPKLRRLAGDNLSDIPADMLAEARAANPHFEYLNMYTSTLVGSAPSAEAWLLEGRWTPLL